MTTINIRPSVGHSAHVLHTDGTRQRAKFRRLTLRRFRGDSGQTSTLNYYIH